MEDTIDTIEIRSALDEARLSLRQTVAEVNHRFARASAQLVSEYLAERCLPAGICISGLLGFAAGNRDTTGASSGGGLAGVATLILSGLLGAVLTGASKHGRNHVTTAQ
jgi:hypothetical protein